RIERQRDLDELPGRLDGMSHASCPPARYPDRPAATRMLRAGRGSAHRKERWRWRREVGEEGRGGSPDDGARGGRQRRKTRSGGRRLAQRGALVLFLGRLLGLVAAVGAPSAPSASQSWTPARP